MIPHVHIKGKGRVLSVGTLVVGVLACHLGAHGGGCSVPSYSMRWEICSTKHARRESRDNDIEGDIAVAVAAAAAAQLPPANCQLLLLGALILEEEQSRNCVSYSNNLQGSLQGLRHRMCGYRKRSLSDLIKGTDRPIWPSTDDLVLSATQKDMTRSLSEIW